MNTIKQIYLGIDCGATTSKISAVDSEGAPISTKLRQRPTQLEAGTDAIIAGWMDGTDRFLEEESHDWEDVAGIGVAMPGPYQAYGVLGRMPNMPASLEGWDFLGNLTQAVTARAKRPLPVSTANDGLLAGVAEARHVQRDSPGSVFMLAPGSGLGCSYVDADGGLLTGDHQAAVMVSHSPAPYETLGLPRFRCGCGRDWGCHEAYTSISGLPKLLELFLPDYPDHPLHQDTRRDKEKVLSLRDLAQTADPLALKIFDTQAAALGLTVAAGCMAYDPSHVIIGGGLMDAGATTEAFRHRYLENIRNSAARYLWVDAKKIHYAAAQLGELSQAIGAALLARSH